MAANDLSQREALNNFFRVRGTSINRCHEPEEQCNKKAIRAHSIANGNILSRMSYDGHVVMPRIKFRHPHPPEFRFERIGRNSATTFSGLCAGHDNALFRSIDNRLPNIEDKEHLFLLGYRAVLREYHVVLEEASRAQATYLKRVDVGLSSRTESDAVGLFATQQLRNAYDCYQFKREFDRRYLSRDWIHLEHRVVVLPNQPPSIAVSSLFSLDDVGAPELPRVALNVFPVGNDVVVVFSAIPRDASAAYSYLQRLLAAEPYLQKYLLSKLILQSCDNIVIHPRYYESMTKERRRAISDFFARTLFDNEEAHEDQRLYLF